MKKVPFLTLEKAREIAQQIPTPFHIYDEAGIRANARALKATFSWNQGFREYFAVKATPNPYIIQVPVTAENIAQRKRDVNVQLGKKQRACVSTPVAESLIIS